MSMVLYEKPMKIELKDYDLFVSGKKHERSARTVSDMKKTLMTQFPEDIGDFDAYYMYRDVFRNGDIRFDITVIPFRPLGDEYPKTHGHFHPGSEGGLAYPEVYQVLQGSALFVLQKRRRDGSVDVLLVDAKEKGVVLIPPGYGHHTINNGKGVLILSNLVYDRLTPLYDEYRNNKGSAYYYVKGGSLVQNTGYFIHRNERLGAAELNKRHDFECSDLLSEFHENPEKFAFLEKPEILFKKEG